jgi:hypothetical protein
VRLYSDLRRPRRGMEDNMPAKKLPEIPEVELKVKEYGTYALFSRGYSISGEQYEGTILLPFLTSSQAPCEKFNALYRRVGAAFLTFCEKNAKHLSGKALLSFKVTYLGSDYVSLYLDMHYVKDGKINLYRKGQIFKLPQLCFADALKIFKKSRGKTLSLIRHELKKRCDAYSFYTDYHRKTERKAGKLFDPRGGYIGADSVRFCYPAGVFSDFSEGITVFGFRR